LGNKQVVPDGEMREKMAAAIKTVTVVKPKKARKLLVIESLHGMYHNPGIPNCNVLLDMMGKSTGAWETEFSDDLNNLKYPAIKKYDAVFVNSAVNEMFPDPLVREGLVRFVKEGGGLGGIHGTPWASRNWQEFADMIGSRSAPHRIENGVIRAYDPSSPLVKSFAGKPLQFRDEFYRFEDSGYNRLMWENVRVLLAVDVEVPQSSPWTGYKRPDNIYPVSWIRTYGKGRSFYCSLGHMAETFIQPEIVAHLFSGVQFILGDLDVDTTPNPHQTAAK
jgi:type 1 glutamine amidotransferase